MTNKCKCKCRKDDVVVLLNNSPGGGTFEEFLISIEPPLRDAYDWDSFIVNESSHNWSEVLKSKLQQLCKKKGKKPIVVSALFDADLEMQLAPFQQYISKFYSSSSADEFKFAFGNIETLALPETSIPRSNEIFYKNGGLFDNFFAAAPVIPTSFNNNSIFFSLAKSGYPIERISEFDDISRGTILGDAGRLGATEIYDKIGQSIDNLDKTSTLSASALAQVTLSQDNSSRIEELEGQNYLALDGSEGTKYVKIYSGDSFSAEKNLQVLTNMGGMERFFGGCPTNERCYVVNLASSAAQAVNCTNGFRV